jgi:hypothetical protein
MALSENWFVEGSTDFEMQKYRLLAYLQEIESSFAAQRLYPPLRDLRRHYLGLQHFMKNKAQLSGKFPQRISALNLANGHISWEQVVKDDSAMEELGEITSYAEGKMRHTLDNGASIYEAIVRQMAVEPVGINPPGSRQGYLLLRLNSIRETRAYSYYLTQLEVCTDNASPLRLRYLGSWPLNLANTPNSIKLELIRNASALHSPSAYALETSLKMPLEETLLPVATQVFSRYLAASA